MRAILSSVSLLAVHSAAPRRPNSLAPPRAGARAAATTLGPASVWPAPQTMSMGTTAVFLDSSFEFSCASAVCPQPLNNAFSQYADIIFFAGPPVPAAPNQSITGLAITILSDEPLALGVSENYTLSVPAAGGVAVATADTQWGALRALETFSQLFSWGGNGVPITYGCASAPVVINDFPRWPWRAVLIDSSRHFLTPAAIKVTIDAMQSTKLNTIHWHLVDDNSWPLVSTTLPLMSVHGAYSPEATYTHEDITELVSYAADRGIRIVPEFDMPAHASIWGAGASSTPHARNPCGRAPSSRPTQTHRALKIGYPQFTISCSDGQTLLNPVPAAGLYDAIDGLLSEFLPLFHSADFVHFGGDEVQNLQCWNESAQVQAFMAANGLADVNAVRNFFETQIQSIAAKHNASSMFWEEVFDKNYSLLPESIVDVWLSFDEVEAALKAGHRIVNSFGLYLDQQDPFGPQHYFWADTCSFKSAQSARTPTHPLSHPLPHDLNRPRQG